MFNKFLILIGLLFFAIFPAKALDPTEWLQDVGDSIVGVPFTVENDHLAHVCAAWWFRTGQTCDPFVWQWNGAMPTFMVLLNETRVKGGWCGNTYNQPVPPVGWSWSLQEAARDMVKDQIAKGYSGHTSPTGKTARDWARDRGYPWWVRDNLATNPGSDSDVMARWLADPPHCEPIFDPETKRAAGYREGNKWALFMGWDGFSY